MTLRSSCKPKFIAVTTTRNTTTTTKTTQVLLTTLGNEGHVTRLSSEKVSLSFLPILTKIFGFFSSLFTCFAIANSCYTPIRRRKLLALFMLRMLFAERAVLGNSQPVGIVALILVAIVITMLALGTFKGYLSPNLCFHFRKLRTKKLHPHSSAN